MTELYSEGTSLLSCFKYFNDDYMEYVEMAARKEEEKQ